MKKTKFKVNRRDFLKIMGWGGAGVTLAACDMPSTVTMEEGKEHIVSYLVPEEYVIPGIGVWFASTCQQCSAGCGVHGRVREGRLLKLEGNPDSPINKSKLCQMGQAGLQNHYNPDRITQPRTKQGEISWDEALQLIDEKLSASRSNRFAWFSGTVSGHQAVLMDALAESTGSSKHFVHEVIHNAVGQAVNSQMLGDAAPEYRLDKAGAILSFGADFLGTWQSQVHFSAQYADFRSGDRGVLIQVEPNMSLTGGNADLWVPANPGTEGVLALGIANVLMSSHGVAIPGEVKSVVSSYDVAKVAGQTGVPEAQIKKIASILKERSPSLVLSGASAQGHMQGYDIAAATMLLNVILGNINKTVVAKGAFPFKQLQARSGSTKDLLAFADEAANGNLDVVFFYGTNPVYSAPDYLDLTNKLKNIPFKVVFSNFEDETAKHADLVLPLHSSYEDWGTHVASYQGQQQVIGFQQPLMEPLYEQTRGFGDVLIALLAKRDSKYAEFKDYYGYLKNAVSNMPGKNASTNAWTEAQQNGFISVTAAMAAPLKSVAIKPRLSAQKKDSQYGMYLVPAARLGMWDGRHANLPWLQEAPDQITKAVWDSWAEIHPVTAKKLGVKEGDIIKISSRQGNIEAKVYVHRGVHKNAVAVPMGQGHDNYGRYASRGVNPLKILDPVTDSKTGELALYATRVNITNTGNSAVLVRLGGSDTQQGRKLAVTITADQYRRTEGGNSNVA